MARRAQRALEASRSSVKNWATLAERKVESTYSLEVTAPRLADLLKSAAK